MRFIDIKYKKFILPLKTPIKNSFSTIKDKDIIIIKAKDEKGNCHFGEVSPLKGFSPESITECELKLLDLIKSDVLKKNIEDIINTLNDLPSLMFGLEQLILSASPKEKFSNINAKKSIKINAFLGIEKPEITLKKVEELANLGYKTIKLKIGRTNFEDDFSLIKLLDNKFGKSLKIRLDNNGNWTLNEAVKNIEQLSKFNIEYIEQPVQNKNELLKLADISNLSIAADESLINYDHALDIANSDKINYLILKPSIRLGIFNSINLIELFKYSTKNVIISSAFETNIGRLTLLFIASLTSHNLAHGLNAEVPGSNIIKSEIDFHKPEIDLSKVTFNPNLNLNI